MGIDQYNYHLNSEGKFQVSNKPVIKPDYISLDKKSGKPHSLYYYTPDGLYRHSNHWGRVAKCKWELAGIVETVDKCEFTDFITGFIPWKDLVVTN